MTITDVAQRFATPGRRRALARIVQHECDHLKGMVYIDHVSGIRKQLIRSKLSNIVNGKIRCDYPVKFAPRKKK